MRVYRIVGGVVLVAFTAGIILHVNGEPQPHTLANSFGNVYMSTAFGTSAERLRGRSRDGLCTPGSISRQAPPRTVPAREIECGLRDGRRRCAPRGRTPREKRRRAG